MTSPGHISLFSGYSNRIKDLTRTFTGMVLCSVHTYTVNTLTNATPVLYSTFNYYSTVLLVKSGKVMHLEILLEPVKQMGY